MYKYMSPTEFAEYRETAAYAAEVEKRDAFLLACKQVQPRETSEWNARFVVIVEYGMTTAGFSFDLANEGDARRIAGEFGGEIQIYGRVVKDWTRWDSFKR